jgi:hypothetical protein
MSDGFPCPGLPWPPDPGLFPAWPVKTRAQIGGPAPYVVEVEWAIGTDGHPESGQWACTGAPPTTRMLRSEIPRILEGLRAIAELHAEAPDGDMPDSDAAAQLRAARKRARRRAAGPGRPPLTDDYLRDVGRTWTTARARRKRPVLAVAARYRIPRNTAADHVARARRLGYIEMGKPSADQG